MDLNFDRVWTMAQAKVAGGRMGVKEAFVASAAEYADLMDGLYAKNGVEASDDRGKFTIALLEGSLVFERE